MNEDIENIQIDGRLLMLMQWLKDNDESGLQDREHANASGYMADIINTSYSDSA